MADGRGAGDRRVSVAHVPPAILFDMNGVLVDDEDLHFQAARRVVEGMGLSMSGEEYGAFFFGRTDREGFGDFFARRTPSVRQDVAGVVAEKSRAYSRLAASGLRACEGAAELVRSLDRAGFPLGLVTGAIRAEAEAVLALLEIGDLFRGVVTAEDVSAGKPSPEPYLRGASRLGREPRECVVIEDSPSGVRSARAAGMACIAVTSTYGARDLAEADLVVARLTELTVETIKVMAA
nr:HAD family phosphatase [Planomonospora venezuelensis]